MRHFQFLIAATLLLPLLNAESAAHQLYQKTEYRAALAALKPAESSDPADWHLAGRALFQLGEYKQAQEWFEKATRAEPKSAEHMLWLGKTFGRRAEHASFVTAPKYAAECRKAFEKAVDIDPRNLEAWSDLFEYYLSAPGFLGGGSDKAAGAAARIGRLDKAEGQYALAKLAEKKEDVAGAEKHWRAAIEWAPRNAGRWIDLATFLARLGRHPESDKAFEKAAEADPDASARIWFARAEANIEHKRNLGEARELLNRYLAAQVTPDDPSKSQARQLLKKIS